MSDFFQTGAIATLHRLGPNNLAKLEAELCLFAQENPIALVLPCHIREVGTKALKGILRELRQVPYLSQIVVGSRRCDGRPAVGESQTLFRLAAAETHSALE